MDIAMPCRVSSGYKKDTTHYMTRDAVRSLEIDITLPRGSSSHLSSSES